jgi:nucleoside-diphosphate kinase
MRNKYPSIEQSFVMLKPDAVSRGLVGRIFQRFEEQGLKLVAARMLKATKELVAKHYPGNNDEWLYNLGKKSTKSFNDNKRLVKEAYGTDDFKKIGQIIYKAMVKYIISGPIIITVWEGNHAIGRIRQLVGSTVPTFAEVGSIRGSYAFDTPALAVKAGRITFKTLVHASDSVDEASREIKNWFGEKFKDLSNYERIDYVDIF